MTRIIAGAARGARLRVPRSGTRPTSDRVRESLFAALEATGLLPDGRVLDLYAGSGALGLECASRGAARVDLVERAAAAVDIVRTNASVVRRALGEGAPPVEVHATSVRGFLRSARGPWDLVFLDPPYDLADDELTADLVAVAGAVTADGLVIVERATRSGAPQWATAGMRSWRERAYGDTSLWWGELGS